MNRLFHHYIFTFLLLFTALGASGADVVIHGKVTDQDSKPVEFATVRIKGTALGATTGLEGDYRLSTAARDTIVVIFTCIGYNEESRTLIKAKGDVTLNMRLRENTKMLGEVEVTEIKKQTGSMQRIDASDYKFAADATGGSVESLITTMAGVSSSNELSSQYSVRGGTYDENSVYINGIEVYRPQLISSGQQEGLSIINPDMVGAIGFSTGGFTAEYADKMSSALDITYRTPESFEGSLGLSLMGGNLAIGQSSKHFSQLHGVRYKRNNSLLSSLETRGEYDPRYFDYQTFLTLKLSQKVKLSVLGNISVNDYKFTPVNRTTNFGTAEDAKQFTVYFDGHEKDKFETYFGAFTLDYRPSRGTQLQLLASGFLTNELVTYDISGEYWLDQAGAGGGDDGIGGELGVGRYHEHARNRLKSSVIDVALKGVTSIRGGHTLTYGLGFRRQSVMERSREWELRDSAGYSLPASPDLLKVIYNLSAHEDLSSTRINAFVQDNWRINSAKGYFNINAGLRLSHWSYNSETLISPRVNIGFIPEASPSWAFRVATGLYYQAPYYKELRQIITDENGNGTVRLNSEIKSPRSWQFIAGADYTFRAFNRPFKLSGEIYYKAMSRLIPYELDNLKIVYSGLNESSGMAAGVDFKLFGQFVAGSDSWISFSLMKTQETLRGVKVPRPNDRRYNLALYFTDYFPRFPKLKFSLRGILSDGLPAIASHSSRDKGYFRTPAYKRVDVGLMYGLLTPVKEGEPQREGFLRHFKSIWLGVDVFNLLDVSNVSSYYWVTDVNNIQYAVPNYLTRRQFNVRLSIDF
ncbi:MAG: carboxypeptidase-like regulatory domain-containing protein [Firmicutes bacterium]|nr:carboxypeptidase-like regulatory domain-containing protein [Bacillota bacterium]MCM1401856.1 carboxypeptidase-like regulatory domain-containing protein [Bacteroides sp.]MCM1477730.1 carboxypeptidase-like regulatory domain-containing protein [Bacteroides sp.]